MTKKLLLLCLLVVLTTALRAQNINLFTEDVSRNLNRALETQFLCTDGDRLVCIEYSGRLKNRRQLVCYDMSQREVARTDMGKTADYKCYTAFVNGQTLDMLEGRVEKGLLQVWHRSRAFGTLEEQHTQRTLMQLEGTAQDRMGLMMATSANGQLVAVVYVAQRQQGASTVQVAVYDRHLQTRWLMASECRRLGSVYVTDSGEVVLSHYDPNGVYAFRVLDGKQEQAFHFTITDKATDVQVVAYAQQRLLLAAAVGSRTSQELGNGPWMRSLEIYAYNTRDNHLDHTQHTFSDLEVNRLIGRDDSDPVGTHRVQFGNIAQTLPDTAGGYIMIDQQWTRTIEGVPTDHYRIGMLTLRIDLEGNIVWRNASRLAMHSSSSSTAYLGHRWIPTSRGIMLVFNENVKDQDRSLTRSAVGLVPCKNKAVMTVLCLARNGREERRSFPLGRYAMQGAPMLTDQQGDYLVYVTNGSRGSFAHLTID